jgi:uncharacterized protein
VIAVDTNILVYSHRADSTFHAPAASVVRDLAESGRGWAVPWPCIHEFLAIVTHPRIYVPPTPLKDAIIQIERWLSCPTLVLLTEGDIPYWKNLKNILETSRVSGPQIHDGRIAALCVSHGIDELWTADRDFSRFPSLRVRNPLVEAGRKFSREEMNAR